MEIKLTIKFLREDCERITRKKQFDDKSRVYVGDNVIFIMRKAFSFSCRGIFYVNVYRMNDMENPTRHIIENVICQGVHVFKDELVLYDAEKSTITRVTVDRCEEEKCEFLLNYPDKEMLVGKVKDDNIAIYSRESEVELPHKLDRKIRAHHITNIIEVDGEYWSSNNYTVFENLETQETFKIDKVENVVKYINKLFFGYSTNYFMERKGRSYYFYSYEDIIRNKGKISDTPPCLVVNKTKDSLYDCFIVGKYLYFRREIFKESPIIYRFILLDYKAKSARSVVN